MVRTSGRDRGRIIAAARAMTFGQLAAAIDDAFGRWDLAHLHTVELADGMLLIGPGDAWDDPPQGRPVERTDRAKLSRLALGEQFAYTFDLGDDWTPPVHGRRPAHRSIRGTRRGARPASGVLGLGEPARSVRTPVRRGRRRDACAAGPARVRPAADPVRLGTATSVLSPMTTETPEPESAVG